MLRLSPGSYWGQILRSRVERGFILCETEYRPSLRLPRHSHANAYFCFVRLGSYTETFGGKKREVTPRTLAFHPPGEEHAECFHSREVRSFNIELAPEKLSEIGRLAPAFQRAFTLHERGVARLVLQLYQEFVSARASPAQAVEGLVLEIAAEAWRRAKSLPAPTPHWLMRARELVQSAFPRRLSLAEIAAETGIHPVHLATEFRRYYGITVGEYVRKLRVDWAARRLLETETPLIEIALEAGFCDQSHFTRSFCDTMGVPPGEYRQARRREQELRAPASPWDVAAG